MEQETSQKIRLGVFVIFGTLLFLGALYVLGNRQFIFGNTSNIKAVFENVSGLQIGNNVRYAGIDIGTVTNIEMENDTIIYVTMIIENKMMTHLKRNAIASISSDGLVGNMVINIVPGKGDAPLVENGDLIASRSKAGTDAMLETLDVTNKNAALLTADLLKITNEINQGKGTVGLLLKDSLMSNDLQQTMRNLKETTRGTAESVANLNKMILSLNQKDNVFGVLNDKDVASQMKSIISNLEKSSGEINKVVTNLNETVVNIKDGKGALNYLSNDPKLVKQIDETMLNLNTSSIKLNENLEALKHNFFFRGYFKKQEKKKAKEAEEDKD